MSKQRPSSAPPVAMDIPISTEVLLAALKEQTGKNFRKADLSGVSFEVEAEQGRLTVKGVLCKPDKAKPEQGAIFEAIQERYNAVNGSEAMESLADKIVTDGETPADFLYLRNLNLRYTGLLTKVRKLYTEQFPSRPITDEGLRELLEYIVTQEAQGKKIRGIGEGTKTGLSNYLHGVDNYRAQRKWRDRKRAERRSGSDRRGGADRRQGERNESEEGSELAG